MTTERAGRRRAFLLGAASMLVLWTGAVVAWGAIGGDGADDAVAGLGSGELTAVGTADGLTIHGSLTVPLRPGVGERLDLVLVNDTGSPVAVDGLTVRIAEVVAPRATERLGCTADDFAVEQSGFALELGVDESSSLTAAGATQEQLPLVAMLDTDVDQAGCIGATLELELAAVGRLA